MSDLTETVTRAVPTVVLVGPSGSGRSSVGVALADALSVALMESEEFMGRKTGRSFSEILLGSSHEEFQALVEESTLRLLSEEGVVTLVPSATNIPTVQEALRQLKNEGVPVVALTVPTAELARRSGLNAPRSMGLGQPRSVFAQFVREAYEQYSTFMPEPIDNVGRAPKEVACTIIERFALQ